MPRLVAFVLALSLAPLAALAQPMAAADYLREAAMGELFEQRAAELAAEKARSATVMSLGVRLSLEQDRARAALALVAQREGLAAPAAELDPARSARLAELQGLTGSAFDRAYIAQQRTTHEQAIALHGAYAQAGDRAALKAYAAEAAARERRHLAMLKAM